MAEPTAKKEVKERRPSAQKRDLQNTRKRLRNRSYQATVKTAIRNFQQSLDQKEPTDAVRSKLNMIFSLMDKGVKKGVFKLNKASRIKSRLTTRVA